MHGSAVLGLRHSQHERGPHPLHTRGALLTDRLSENEVDNFVTLLAPATHFPLSFLAIVIRNLQIRSVVARV